MNIPIVAYRKELGDDRLLRIAGVKFKNGVEKAELDILKGDTKEDDRTSLRRWDNFQVAYCHILSKYKPSELAAIWYNPNRTRHDWELISEALDHAEKEYFIKGQPCNLSDKYAELLAKTNKDYRDIINKAFYVSEKQRERKEATAAILAKVE